MARLSTNLFMISLLATISAVYGCGVMPAGQTSTRTFTITGFTLPVAIVYSRDPAISAQVGGIATSKEGAEAFVLRLIMQIVLDVIENQGRSAFLPDAVISAILGQIEVKITYEPMECQKIVFDLMKRLDNNAAPDKPMSYCIIIDNTVTGICTTTGNNKMCGETDPQVKITPVSGTVSTISGTISTSNIILANWSKAMWQNVVNRAVRTLASSPFASNFFSATATVNGN
ncbi:hypothetical protein KIN20_037238 [Parelaphostrongylus tenuis]|uniref:Uncharacterized protein n=1 Tax=Parelaphostrongylus tenuis TaxID=148309 RepID=A0AAD5RDP3_PARTN|nr:hypothetical protein KIN20_037238 [Parelaphostrongylus tenuis]